MPSRYAFLFGCNDYANLPQLNCPRNDVEAMAELLGDPAIGGFDSVTKFTEGESNGQIAAALEELITSTSRLGDLVVIYFSGHGKVDELDRLYLATHGTKETVLDSTSIAIDRVMGYAHRNSGQTMVLILDCCYSGAIDGTFRVEGALAGAAQRRGLHIMTSSTGLQQSHEKEGETNSIFTKFLVDGLRTGRADVDNDGVITADEAFSYTQKLVSGTGKQSPTKFNVGVMGDIVLAKNCRYVPVVEPDPTELSPEDFRKFFAVKTMIDLLRTDRPGKFHVSLDMYYIECDPYPASALTVSVHHTLNMRQTNAGFECDAFYPPRMISQNGQRGKEVINGVIKVRMRVDLKDIRNIIGRLKDGQGRQVDLYRASSS